MTTGLPLMRRGRVKAVVFFALVIFGVSVLVWFKRTETEDPLFRGLPESIWIKDLAMNDPTQVEEWKGFGEEGLQVLVRGFQNATDPAGRLHRNFDQQAPDWLRKRLPNPKRDRGAETRLRIASLLWSLGPDTQSAASAMVRFAEKEENVWVLQSIIGYFVTGGDISMLNTISAAERRALLPVFVRAMRDPSMQNARHNASIGFKYFREDAEAVTPVLIDGLKDPSQYVRLYSAESLNCIAPDAAKKAGAMGVLINIVNSGLTEAVNALSHPGTEIQTAVQTLTNCLASTNREVACQAVWTLEWAPHEFHRFGQTVIPALRTASLRNDYVAGYAKTALQRWEERKDRVE